MEAKNITSNLRSAAAASLIAIVASASAQSSPATPDSTATTSPDSLVMSTYNLDELVVNAKRPVVTSDGAKLTYNVEEDESSKGSTVLDMLRKVPMVSVDGQDKIRIQGKENFKIYVNGKEDQFLSANYDKVLKAMPAESIAKVEVITEPDAKYDAEGTGGILNIITVRKRKDEGLYGSVSLSGGNRESGATLFAGLKKKNVNISLNLNYFTPLFSDEKNNSTRTQENLKSEANRYFVEKTAQTIGFGFWSGSLSMSWEPSERDLFTIDMNGNLLDGNVKKLTAQANMYSSDMRRQWGYTRDITGSLFRGGGSINASYQHDFGNEHNIILSYLFNYGKADLNALYCYYDVFNTEIEEPYKSNRDITHSREHTVQADYANPFGGDKHLLETGVKGIWRHNTAMGYTGSGMSEGAMTPDAAASTDMLQYQDIYSLYASYTGKFGPLTAKGGARYEHTGMGIDFRNMAGTDFTDNLDDVVPNASLTYSFSPVSNLRLAYLMRISRPSISQVNPYMQELNANSIRCGNPDLESERSNKVSLTYSDFAGSIGGNIGVEYSCISNAITSYEYLKDGVAYTTFANMGDKSEFAVNGFLTWTIIPNMRLSVNGRLAYNDLRSHKPDTHNHGWSVNYGANWNYTLPHDFTLSAYGGQQTRTITLQGHYTGWYYYGVSVAKSFLPEKALNIALNAGDFLQKSRRMTSETITPDMKVTNEFSRDCWRVSLTVTWNFGKQSSSRKTDRRIKNDDKASVGGGQGQGVSL